jgi:predicted transcriptional regulator
MAALQIDIMKIRQLILLKSKKISNRKIAIEIGVDRNTVNEYVQKLGSSGYSFEELLTWEEKRSTRIISISGSNRQGQICSIA